MSTDPSTDSADHSEWKLFSVFECETCRTKNPNLFEYPFNKLCRKHTPVTQRERKKRRGNQLPHKCSRCCIRFAEDSMACKNICKGCWFAATGSHYYTLN